MYFEENVSWISRLNILIIYNIWIHILFFYLMLSIYGIFNIDVLIIGIFDKKWIKYEILWNINLILVF